MQSISKTESNLNIKKPSLNPVLGKIDSLCYHANGNNLAEVKIQEHNSDGIFTFTAFSNVNLDFNTIKIANFNDFSFRLQEAFNNQSLVSIFYQDDRIILVEIIRQVLDFDLATATVGRPSNGGSGGTGGGG